jgi:phosphate starvation-inducible protein PhoH
MMPAGAERLTKRERRILRQQEVLTKENQINTKNFHVSITPKGPNQERAHEYWKDGYNLMLHGYAGTGKTFLALGIALKEVLSEHYKKVIVVRSAVPTRDIGFLPGTAKKKMEVYELPYKNICNELFQRGDAYEILYNKFMYDFIPTSYIRGTTLDNCIVIVDEINNMTFHELDSVITRLGYNTRCIFCGDFRQSDLKQVGQQSGIDRFMDIVQKMKQFKFIDFGIDDIVRSGIVRDYIIAKADYDDENPQRYV